MTASAKGIRSRTIACPVIVVVETINGRWGCLSFSFLASGTLESASPTDTACSQIASARSFGNFSKPGNENPIRCEDQRCNRHQQAVEEIHELELRSASFPHSGIHAGQPCTSPRNRRRRDGKSLL